jgi:hypothetical protein
MFNGLVWADLVRAHLAGALASARGVDDFVSAAELGAKKYLGMLAIAGMPLCRLRGLVEQAVRGCASHVGGRFRQTDGPCGADANRHLRRPRRNPSTGKRRAETSSRGSFRHLR